MLSQQWLRPTLRVALELRCPFRVVTSWDREGWAAMPRLDQSLAVDCPRRWWELSADSSPHSWDRKRASTGGPRHPTLGTLLTQVRGSRPRAW